MSIGISVNRAPLFFIAFIIGVSGCGVSAEDNSNASVHTKLVRMAGNQRSQAEVRAVRWDIANSTRSAVELGAFVSYCEGSPEPSVEKVVRGQRSNRITLTFLVRVRPRRGSACVGYDFGLSRWVKLGIGWRKTLSIYDGSSTPPVKRWPVANGRDFGS